MMTYTISAVCSSWYYGIQGEKGSLFTGYKRMIRQFGSLVFGGLVIALVTFARMMVNSKRNDGNNKNVAAAVCLCIMACILKAV